MNPGTRIATLPVSADSVNPPSAAAHSSPAVCIRADIARAIGGLIWACVIIAGLLWGEWFADLYLSAGFIAVLVVGGFAGLLWYIVSDLRRAFRRSQRRRYLAASGLCAADLEDLAGAPAPTVIRGEDCL